jgi:hypothetical protein
MLRHPADGSQWRKIEREFPDFAGDARNLWFGLSTDGMHESFWGAELQSQHLARYSMYLQPSSLVVHEAEVYYDASAHPRSEATRQ